MTLFDELYFEITLRGEKAELKRFVKFLESGELDDFFEINNEYISYDDDFAAAADDAPSEIVFTNDDVGIQIGELNPEEFLDVFCKGTKNLDVVGTLYDVENEEYRFESHVGDTSYTDSRDKRFHDELDDAAYHEEADEEEI